MDKIFDLVSIVNTNGPHTLFSGDMDRLESINVTSVVL